MPASSDPTRDARRNVSLTFVMAYMLGFVLLSGLVYFGSFWDVLANTRVLSLLINGGVVAYHDAQMGFVEGVANFGQYLKAMEPIHWEIIILVAACFTFFWLSKGLQFHLLCRFYGMPGTLTSHAQAYYRGLLYDMGLPGHVGKVAAAAALQEDGAEGGRAMFITRVMDVLVMFEIVVYAAIGLVLSGWSMWLVQIFVGALIAFGAWWMTRPSGDEEHATLFEVTSEFFGDLGKRPAFLIGLCLLSLLAFGVEDVAAYATAMAFSGEHVRLHASFGIILMGVVGSYIARFFPVTPGGVGQFEWGFAAALYFGGLGFPECVTIALLDNVLRYITFGAFYLITTLRQRKSDLSHVMSSLVTRRLESNS